MTSHSSNALPVRQSPTKTPEIRVPGAIVHTQYDVRSPPQKPAEGNWTRFVCISDTHEHVFPVPPGDVLLHGGDLTHTGRLKVVRGVVQWLSELPHPKKIVIAGNHDLTFHTDWYMGQYQRWHWSKPEDVHAIKDLFTNDAAQRANIIYLENSSCEVQARPDGKVWSIYGSPWQPEFGGWAFNYERGEEARKIVAAFPKTDILITHGPPYGVLDRTVDGTPVGCEELLRRLPSLRPRLHVFGHIHEGHGANTREWTPSPESDGSKTDRTVFVNAANWPMGHNVAKDQLFGEGAFMPVIVDLLEA